MLKLRQFFCNHHWKRRPFWQLTDEEFQAANDAGEIHLPWRCIKCNKEIAVSTETWLKRVQ